MTRIQAVVFDLGGVVIDWNPRHLYRKLFAGDEAAMEAFLGQICPQEWNERFDRGEPFKAGVMRLAEQHPEHAAMIQAYWQRWPEMVNGTIDGTVAVLAALRERRVPLYALSNWSAETFAMVRGRFEFLRWFSGIVISGEVGIIKPDPRIFHLLSERFRLTPRTTLVVDDVEANVAGARAAGFAAIRFTSPHDLREHLGVLGLLPPAA